MCSSNAIKPVMEDTQYIVLVWELSNLAGGGSRVMAKKLQGSMSVILFLSLVAASMHVEECVGGTDICPTVEEAVFPYISYCNAPATYAYLGGAAYVFQSWGSGTGSKYYLAPEWDETNSTYYVRLVSEQSSAARYELTYTTEELRPYVAVNDTGIVIVNADSGRSLAWRDEGSDQFLIESSSSAALFKFSLDTSSKVPCITAIIARCGAYNIVSSATPSFGLSPYEEDGVVYFTLSSDDLVPFILRTSISTQMPCPRS
jgi:hypothetical protein